MSTTPSGSQAQPMSSQPESPSASSSNSSRSDTAGEQYRDVLHLIEFLSKDIREKITSSPLSEEKKSVLRATIGAAIFKMHKDLGSLDGSDFKKLLPENREKTMVLLKELISVYWQHIEHRARDVVDHPFLVGPEALKKEAEKQQQ
ncbi:hypothetical protein QBC45DRAFT_456116 [Copromyces sp. CBS 386.78]|nr:hypothetical protein QBC45DRAFT_456116 [Copromyces sp. CBS 386.78]